MNPGIFFVMNYHRLFIRCFNFQFHHRLSIEKAGETNPRLTINQPVIILPLRFRLFIFRKNQSHAVTVMSFRWQIRLGFRCENTAILCFRMWKFTLRLVYLCRLCHPVHFIRLCPPPPHPPAPLQSFRGYWCYTTDTNQNSFLSGYQTE